MLGIISFVFVVGYLSIALEHFLKFNKAATALITGVLCWSIYVLYAQDPSLVNHQLEDHLGEISQILFFLLGAMTIVEMIDAHDGFQIITSKIKTTDTRKLLWIVSFIAFFLSSILDNLTTTIVMVSILRKIIQDKETRLFFVGMTVIAANAGGAWSPIGDVTTTMLWIGNQITPLKIIFTLIVPSLVCLLVPLLITSFKLKGKVDSFKETNELSNTTEKERMQVLVLGILILILVPVFKTVTHLPPFMGILLGLGIMWIVTEWIHKGKNDEDKDTLSVVHAIRKIDTPSILFFLGILLSISVLESTGQLRQLAQYLTENIGNESMIVIAIGLLSSVVDNVPLVAAAQGMFPMTQYPTDHNFWIFLAYATGTGGSILIIGSAAGVAAMGMEKMNFFWYLKKISLLAFLGYILGAFTFMLQTFLFGF
jgi:Na+/H+ antiporter NhaD/arsenite permease-like protein